MPAAPTSPPTSLTVALWATNLAQAVNGIDGWAALVDRRMAEAKAQGAELLVMPEYCSEQWLSFAPAGLAATEEIQQALGAEAGVYLKQFRLRARD